MDVWWPEKAECCYASCYCEENVYKLVSQIQRTDERRLESVFAVFISNDDQCVPLWRQSAGSDDDEARLNILSQTINSFFFSHKN